MGSLNYQHLYYFWNVIRRGSVVAACESLRLAPSTVSAQIHDLEDQLGHKLTRRAGKNLVATETGKLVFQYADKIFMLGEDLMTALQQEAEKEPERVHVGIADVLPKSLARRLIEPALRLRAPARVICHEAAAEELLARLIAGDLDVILSDSPGPSGTMAAETHTRTLAESEVVFMASRKLANMYRDHFPRSMEGAPMLIPTEESSLRIKLDRWLESKRLHPLVVGEFEDHAMLRAFAESGEGIVPIPSLVERQFRRGRALEKIGKIGDIRVQYYGITTEEKIKYPTVRAICTRTLQ